MAALPGGNVNVSLIGSEASYEDTKAFGICEVNNTQDVIGQYHVNFRLLEDSEAEKCPIKIEFVGHLQIFTSIHYFNEPQYF